MIKWPNKCPNEIFTSGSVKMMGRLALIGKRPMVYSGIDLVKEKNSYFEQLLLGLVDSC